MKARSFDFPDGHCWQVLADRRNGRPFVQIRITEGDNLLARLEGNPFDSLFQERISTWASNRDGVTPDVATQRLLGITDALFQVPVMPPASSSHTNPLKGVVDVDDFTPEVSALAAPPARTWIVAGVIPQGNVTSFFGPAETAKTTAVMDLAVAVATGGRWLGLPVQKGRVWWLDFDEDRDEFIRRVMSAVKGRLLGEVPSGLSYVPAATSLIDLLPDLASLKATYPPVLIVVDCFNSALGSDAERADVVLPTLWSMREFGSTWLSIDHETKVSSQEKPLAFRMPFGSQAKTAQARSLVSFSRPDPWEHPAAVVLVHQKSSYSRRFEPMPVWVKRDGDAVWLDVGKWTEPPFDTVKGETGKPKRNKAAPPPHAHAMAFVRCNEHRKFCSRCSCGEHGVQPPLDAGSVA